MTVRKRDVGYLTLMSTGSKNLKAIATTIQDVLFEFLDLYGAHVARRSNCLCLFGHAGLWWETTEGKVIADLLFITRVIDFENRKLSRERIAAGRTWTFVRKRRKGEGRMV